MKGKCKHNYRLANLEASGKSLFFYYCINCLVKKDVFSKNEIEKYDLTNMKGGL